VNGIAPLLAAEIRHRGLKRLYECGETRARSAPTSKGGFRTCWLTWTRHRSRPISICRAIASTRSRADLKGMWSVTISNWRIIFRFEAGDALDVDLVDYH